MKLFKRLIPPYLRNFEPYIPSKPDEELKKLYGITRLFRLNNNENHLGPPPSACEAIAGFSPFEASVYPSGDSFYLRKKLAEKYALHIAQIMTGNGANEIITSIIKAFCSAGDNIITADKTFAVYEWVAKFSGIEARLIPLKNFTFDDKAILKTINEKTKIISICNPNNPTGTYWTESKLRNFLNNINEKQIVIVDEAYCEFVEQKDYPDGIKLIRDYPNLVIIRTFSKMYGLAGLRIGYLIGNMDVVDIIRKTYITYSVNTIGQIAAVAALDHDREHIDKTRKMVREGKEFLHQEINKLGLFHTEGEGNFMLIRLPMSDTLAYKKLMYHGIMIRSMTGFRLPNYIRVTISHIPVMELFVEALKKIL
ncbi:MAG: histidinol-phosphate transaminase [Candidatus Eremiobacterota bacterium]